MPDALEGMPNFIRLYDYVVDDGYREHIRRKRYLSLCSLVSTVRYLIPEQPTSSMREVMVGKSVRCLIDANLTFIGQLCVAKQVLLPISDCFLSLWFNEWLHFFVSRKIVVGKRRSLFFCVYLSLL